MQTQGALFEARHHPAKPRRRTAGTGLSIRSTRERNRTAGSRGRRRRRGAQRLLETAACFAPQLRVERRRRQSEMTFARMGVLRRQPLQALEFLQRRLAIADRFIDLYELWMRSGAPGSFD